jgi:ribosome-associated heat shock protein Hsp15
VDDTVRLDKWLWAARFFRTRTLARQAIAGGKVQLDGQRVKPGRSIRPGDRLIVQRGTERFEITVLDTDGRRVAADRVGEKFVEDPASLERRRQQAETARRARQDRSERPRRPGKRERRQIIRFIRRED